MSMWAAIFELRVGNRETATARLAWCVATMARGYMPQGEAISYVTREAVASSMCEPMTASSFILAALACQGTYDLQILPPVQNAGTYKTISMSAIGNGDWEPWSDVPYFVAPAGAIRRAYLTNDWDHVYLRIDLAGPFDATSQRLRLYARDLAGAGGESTNLDREQNPLRRPMSHLVERAVNADAFSRWRVNRGEWNNGGSVDGAWRWDAASGRLAAAIPISALADGTPDAGNVWTHLQLSIADGVATEPSSIVFHYRVSRIDQPWIYGNIER
jgi:hypothetical protein